MKTYFSTSHEYLTIDEEGTGYVGISDYAQKALGNVVYVDMPEVGDEFEKDELINITDELLLDDDEYDYLNNLPYGWPSRKN